jgi:predicted nucleic acid-binding protein
VTTELWVIDCSAAAAFLLQEQEGSAIDSLLRRAGDNEIHLVVPSLFWFELVNTLVTAERRGRITRHQALLLRGEADGLPVATEPPPGSVERRRLHDLALNHRLTAYDASYLELAERQGARLKTLDPDLLALRGQYPWIE